MNYSVWVLVISILALFIVPTMNESALALRIFSSNSSPYGSTYGQWTAKWWTWAMSIPLDVNPLADMSGIKCALGQKGDVWFLAGTLGGPAVRTCTIPAGKAILFPVINVECSNAEFPQYKSELELRKCAISQQDLTKRPKASVDGVDIQSSQMPRVHSPLFNFVFPDKNIFGVPKGPTYSVSDGIWVFLPPLAPGIHTITFGAEQGEPTTLSTTNTLQDTVYHLTVR